MDSPKDNNIELRSEKIRNIIGTQLPFWVRWGTVVIICVFVLLAFIIYALLLNQEGIVGLSLNKILF